LRALHASGWSAWQIFFIIGTDAFAEIATWREFPAVLDAAHFVVIARPGTSLASAADRTPALATRLQRAADPLPDTRQTRVILVEALTRDVSSTTIRARLAAGEAIDDLVPAAVARHVVRHHLYGAVEGLHGQEGK
jgi:nicotinate-nucleotide adenylyltransferase